MITSKTQHMENELNLYHGELIAAAADRNTLLALLIRRCQVWDCYYCNCYYCCLFLCLLFVFVCVCVCVCVCCTTASVLRPRQTATRCLPC